MSTDDLFDEPSVNDNGLTRTNTISVTELAMAMQTDEDTLLQRLAGVLHKREDTLEGDRGHDASYHWDVRIANYFRETKFPRSLFISEDGRVVAIENVWAYLRSNYLSHRAYKDYEAIVDACCDAWNALMRMPDVITSITNRAYAQVKI